MINHYKDKISEKANGKVYIATFVQMNGETIVYKVEISNEWYISTCIVEMSREDYFDFHFGNDLPSFCENYLLK